MERERRQTGPDDDDAFADSVRLIETIRQDLERVSSSLDQLGRDRRRHAASAASEISAAAQEAFGSEAKADAWMVRPNATLDGRAPADVALDADGPRRVLILLERISHGVFG